MFKLFDFCLSFFSLSFKLCFLNFILDFILLTFFLSCLQLFFEFFNFSLESFEFGRRNDFFTLSFETLLILILFISFLHCFLYLLMLLIHFLKLVFCFLKLNFLKFNLLIFNCSFFECLMQLILDFFLTNHSFLFLRKEFLL